LILHFLIGLDTLETYEDFEDIASNEKNIEFSYSKEEFIDSFYSFWQECGYGEDHKTTTVYIRGDGYMTRSEIYAHLEKINRDSELPRNAFLFMKNRLPLLTKVICYNDTITLGNNFSKVVLEQDTSYVRCFIDDDGFLQCDKPSGRIGTTNLVIGTYRGNQLISTEEIEITVAQYNEIAGTAVTISEGSANLAGQALISGTGSSRNRVLMKFAVPVIDASNFIRAEILLDQNGGATAGQNAFVYAMNSDWDVNTVAWDNAPGNYPEQFGQVFLSGSNITATMETTELVRTWMMNPTINFGTILISESEGTNNHKEIVNPRLSLWYLE